MKRIAPLLYTLLAGLLYLSSNPQPVHARIFQPWTFERMAEKAEVLVVCEVLEIKQAGIVKKEDTKWGAQLLAKSASLKILRVFPADHAELTPGKIVTVPFYAYDWKHADAIFESASFPRFRAGQVLMIPLKKSAERWELLEDEDHGQLVPATNERLNKDVPKNALDFLRLEWASALASADVHSSYEAARYYDVSEGDMDAVAGLLAPVFGYDQKRWARLALSLYVYTNNNQPFTDFLKTGQRSTHARLIYRAAQFLDEAGMQERMREEILTPGIPLNTAAQLFWDNKVEKNDALKKRLMDQVQGGSFEAASLVTRVWPEINASDPLARACVAKALITLKSLTQLPENLEDPLRDSYFYTCTILISWGNADELGELLKDFERAFENDRPRYIALYDILGFALPRLAAFHTIALNDREVRPLGSLRYCDWAVIMLGQIVKQDFLSDVNAPIEERDAAVARAKAWLEKHPEVLSKP